MTDQMVFTVLLLQFLLILPHPPPTRLSINVLGHLVRLLASTEFESDQKILERNRFLSWLMTIRCSICVSIDKILSLRLSLSLYYIPGDENEFTVRLCQGLNRQNEQQTAKDKEELLL